MRLVVTLLLSGAVALSACADPETTSVRGQAATTPGVAPTADDQTDVPVVEDTATAITLTAQGGDGPLTFTVATNPTHGVLSGTEPDLTYTPTSQYNGPDSFTFDVDDGVNPVDTGTVTIVVSAVDDSPVAQNDSVATNEDTDLPITLVATDVDTLPGSITYSIVGNPTHGTLTGTPPAVTYHPTGNYNGPDSFTFKANDTSSDSNTGTINITVDPLNDAPVADAQSVSTAEDTAKAITLTGTDVDLDTLTFAIVTGPTNGVLTGSGANRTYTPNGNYNGPDSFTFKVNDGTVDSSAATVSITVTAVNDAPVAQNQSVSTAEDTAKSITLVATDIDGGALTYSIVASPTNGVLTGTPPNVTYTPNGNYNGPDSFTFKANDTFVDSNTATVSITVTAVNDAPVAQNQSVSTAEDTAKAITLVATDAENDTLAYAIVTGPTNGVLTGSGANRTYTPNGNYNGPDSFTFKANDGNVDSNTATVSITVTPVNDPPVANNQSTSTNEDTAKVITMTGSDIDVGDTMAFAVLASPTHGVLTGSGATRTYTPTGNYNGPDTFTFQITDSGPATSGVATVSITVSPINDAPVASNSSASTPEDVIATIPLTATDVDGDTLTYSIVSSPIHGTLTGSGASRTYTPTANYNGPDSFTWRASDGTVFTSTVTVSITVTPVNDAPVASGQSQTTAEDTAKAITLAATDIDSGSLTYAIVASPTHGTLTGTPPNVTYTPALNYNGLDAFTFRANDGTTNSNTATVNLTVTPVNDAPVATAASVSTPEETTLSINLTGTDVDGNVLTFTVLTQPTNGTLTGTAPDVFYLPATNYNGPDSFTFRANDGTVNSATATVSITVTPVNDVPVATAQSVSTPEDTAKSITLAATDADGNPLTYSIVASPTHGVLTGTPPNVTYTPTSNYSGNDSFTFRAFDGTAFSNTAAVAISVTAVNDPPVAIGSTATTNEDTPVGVTYSGTDVEGSPLSFAVVTPPAHGSVSGNPPNVTYTPAADYNGADSFTYAANDGQATSVAATVSITINPVNDAPVAANQTINVLQDTTIDVTLTASDVENDTLAFTVDSQPDQGTLSGTPPDLQFTAPDTFHGITTFTFHANDGTVDSNIGTITLRINNGEPTVTAAADLLTPTEGQIVTFSATAADPGGDPLTFAWDFGDGQSSTLQNPSHAYVDDGDYTATVTVSDGLSEVSDGVAIDVQNGDPIIVPSTDDVEGDEATELDFVAAVSDPGTADTVTVTWMWGDGSDDSTGASASHTYADNGEYEVTIAITDSDGGSSGGTRNVTINNVPPVPEQQETLTTEALMQITTQLQAEDRAGDADPITWSLVDGPDGVTITASGAFSWVPPADAAGTHVITAMVSDDDGGEAEMVFSVTVTPGAGDTGGCCSSSGGGPIGNGLLLLLALGLLVRPKK